MFELSVACKYLIPRRRQLSVSIISLISVLVIALVVWLIVVFFSVTDGLEKNWIQKLTALTAPVRITPTDAYYHSYYYLIDSISEASNYSNKSIGEKRKAVHTDPYQPDVDEEIPAYWHLPDRNADGTLKDLVKLPFASLDNIKQVEGVHGQDYELTATHIQLRLLRPAAHFHGNSIYGGTTQSMLSYPAYLGNFEPGNQSFGHTLLKIENQDLNNLLSLMGTMHANSGEESQNDRVLFAPAILQKRLANFFNLVEIRSLKTRPSGWTIPRRLLPEHAAWDVCVILKDQRAVKVFVPQAANKRFLLQQTMEEQGLTVVQGKAYIDNGAVAIFLSDGKEVEANPHLILTLAGGSTFAAQVDKTSIDRAKQVEEVRFNAEIPVQGTLLKGMVHYRGLEIANAELLPPAEENASLWIHLSAQPDGKTVFNLPKDPDIGEGIALPKSFRDAGVLVGDRGSLSYFSPTASTLQEQQIPIYVAGFYDPGIIPIGGKYILAGQEVTSLIRASHQQDDKMSMTNGINVRFDRLDQADLVKNQLIQSFKDQGISRYWNVETYREYEFTKEIMRELQSQKNLFMLIAIVIILVACSNIISMLIILVNDKKAEIGILRSMGASSRSIALIFGTAGALIGIAGSAAGILAAVLTLRHMDTLVQLLSRMQGHDMFSANLYGQVLPSELSFEALSFVLIATVCISLLAGIVPAIKACLLRPSHILRSGGV